MSEETITDRIEATIRQLKLEIDLLKSIHQHAPDAIYAKDLEGKYLNISEAGAAYMNVSAQEAIGKNDVELLGEDGVLIMQKDRELFKSGRRVTYETSTVYNEELRHFSTSKSPLKDHSGKIIGLVGISRDITEAKIAEEKYRFLFENAPISFWEEDFSAVKSYIDELKSAGVSDFYNHFEENPDSLERCINLIKVHNVNRSTLDINGIASKKPLIERLDRNFTPESESIFRDEFVALAEGKTEFEAEGSFVNLNNETRDVLFKLNVLPGHEESLSMVLISLVDVTENKKLATELYSIRHRYQSIVEAQTEMICRIDPNGKILFKNLAFSKFFEFKRLNENTRFSLLFPPDELERCNLALEQLTTSNSIATIELRNYNELGMLVWQEWTLTAFFSASGTLLGFQAVGSDVTDRRMAQEALAASEARWRSVIDNADDIIMTVNSEGYIISANESRKRPKDQRWTGKTIAEVIPAESAQEAVDLFNQVFETGKPIKSEFKVMARDQSKLMTYGVSLSPIYHNTRVITVICIARNITEIKEFEKQTKEALIEGQENERMRVSQELHDGLGQLFTGIKLNIQRMRSDLKNANQSTVQDDLLQLEENIGIAISEVKNISRNLMPDVLWQFGLRPAIEELVQKWNSIEGLQIELEFVGMDQRYPQELEKALFRICQELLNNSIRHAQPSQVFVQLINHGDSIVLMVEDDGIGFDPNATMKGFGMRNIRSRADVLEGTVDIDSSLGQGTVTTIEIPLQAI